MHTFISNSTPLLQSHYVIQKVLLLVLLSILPLCQAIQAQNAPEPYNQDYTTGELLYKKGLFPNATDYFDHVERTYVDRHIIENSTYLNTKAKTRLTPALEGILFKEFIHLFPKSHRSGTILIQLGGMAYRSGDYNQAIAYLEDSQDYVVDNNAGSEALYLKAEAYAAINQPDKAIRTFLEVSNRYPESNWAPKALYARGRLYLSSNQYDQATEAFELLRSRHPNDEMTRRIGTALGESYYQQERYTEAIEAFQNAMPYLSADLESKATLLIAESHNYLNNYDEASTYYLRFINNNKNDDRVRQAHYGLGWIYNKQNIYHWAADSFGKASKGDDLLARKALYYKAINEKLGSRYREALETFRSFGEQYKDGLWTEKAYYEWAITAFEVGIYSEAIEVLLPLARRSSSLEQPGDVLTLLGEAYFANGEYSRATQAFEEAEKLVNIPESKKQQAAFQKAWVLYRNQAYESAQPIFEQLYQQNPNSTLAAEALFWSADSYYKLNKFGPASSRFQQFINSYPEHELMGPALYSLGWSHFKMAQFGQATGPLITFLNEYEPPEIALFPFETDTQLRIGDAYYAQGEYEDAIEYYKMAIGAEPGGDYAMFQVANSYYRADRTFEAVTTFRRLLRIYPFSRVREQAQYNIAYIYFLTNNYTQAINEFQSVIKKYPNTNWAARAQYNIGDAYYNAGEYNKAIESYKDVLDTYPRSDYILDAVNGIEYAQLASTGQDSSSAILQDFLKNNPQAATADMLRFRQAVGKLQSGNYTGAIESLKQYLRVTNNDDMIPEAYFNLADAYQQSGNIEEAITNYQIIIENYAQSDQAATSLAILGDIYLRQENYDQSLAMFEKLLDRGGSYRQDAMIGIAEAQLRQNNLDAAENYFSQANSIDNSDAATLGLAKIKFFNQNYQEAEQMFRTIADNNVAAIGAEAQYYEGYALQQQGLYQKALESYSKVSVLFGAFSQWVAKSKFRSAECYVQTDQRGQAVQALTDITESFPNSPEAEKAQELLNQLN